MTARIDYTVTSGTFSSGDEVVEVENNVWIVGDDTECVIIDAPHDVAEIVRVVGSRRVTAILCTHAHDDHVRSAPLLAKAVDAPVLLHKDDLPLWHQVHRAPPDGELRDGDEFPVAGIALEVLHTPGHTPGSVCFYAKGLATVFTGDTLVYGGPGAAAANSAARGILLMSITDRLLSLPAQTIVKTGHGDDTTIADERATVSAALEE